LSRLCNKASKVYSGVTHTIQWYLAYQVAAPMV